MGPLSFNWLFNMVWLYVEFIDFLEKREPRVWAGNQHRPPLARTPSLSLFFIFSLSLPLSPRSIQYGKSVEATVFPGNTPAAIWATACACGLMLAASVALPWLFSLAAYGPSLVMALLYQSVRAHPTSPVSLFGFVTLPSAYLPWAFLVLAFAGLGGDPRGVGLGILAGHVVWFLADVFPRGGGRAVLAPPGWLVRACLARGVGTIPTPAAAAATVNPADPGFRAFGGRGQRLGQRTG